MGINSSQPDTDNNSYYEDDTTVDDPDDREMAVEALEESKPKISRHLAYLRNADIVSARREGKWMHYKINAPEDFYMAQILQDTLESLQSQDEMQADYEKFVKACCGLEVPVTIARAPKPETFAEPHTYQVRKDEELETFLL